MAPIAIHSSPKDSLNAEAESFKPVGNKQVDPYHSATSATAIAAESAYAAHNYHPLPVVFSRAQGVDVWDPEGTLYVGGEAGITILQCVNPVGLGSSPALRFLWTRATCDRMAGLRGPICRKTDAQGERLTARRKPLPRFPLSIQRREPRPLPPRTRQGSRCPGLETDTQLSRILQRCLPSLRREGHFNVGI